MADQKNKIYINIDHEEGKIYNPDGQPLAVAELGGMRIGTGDSLPSKTETDDLMKFKGYLRTNTTTGKLQICTGSEWLDIMTEDLKDEEERIINSLLF